MDWSDCKKCNGTGFIGDKKCPECNYSSPSAPPPAADATLKPCGCGRPARYETETGMACNEYMRCPAPDHVMAKSIIDQVKPEAQDGVSHFAEWFCHKDTLECDGYQVSKGLARSLLSRALDTARPADHRAADVVGVLERALRDMDLIDGLCKRVGVHPYTHMRADLESLLAELRGGG